jgi:hypothetical protein
LVNISVNIGRRIDSNFAAGTFSRGISAQECDKAKSNPKYCYGMEFWA